MIIDLNAVPQKTGSAYPSMFQAQVQGRTKQKVGEAAGLKNFGVNWVTLAPRAASALRHWHEQQDEFIYMVAGELTLITDDGEQVLTPGMMAGFPAGEANGHHVVNRSQVEAVYIEVGDRTSPEIVHYPDDDLQARQQDGSWQFTNKASIAHSI
ncbi:MAG: cupin domain-containing protein [Cyanobacteria bacterium P01_H01_bin.58]